MGMGQAPAIRGTAGSGPAPQESKEVYTLGAEIRAQHIPQ